MPWTLDHPNDPGRWTLLERDEGRAALWQRERSDPMPVTLFYLVAPPRQAQVVYDETQARALFAALTTTPSAEAAQA